MKNKPYYFYPLFVALSMQACSRTARTTEPVPVPASVTNNGETEQPSALGEETNTVPDTTIPADDTNGSILADDVIQIQSSGLCFDVSGKEMTTQFQDQTKNSPTNKTADCYDQVGALLYKGNASNCLEEMQARVPDIIFPAQQVFPKQYEMARAQGANGQSALKTTLGSGTCKDLKAKE